MWKHPRTKISTNACIIRHIATAENLCDLWHSFHAFVQSSVSIVASVCFNAGLSCTSFYCWLSSYQMCSLLGDTVDRQQERRVVSALYLDNKISGTGSVHSQVFDLWRLLATRQVKEAGVWVESEHNPYVFTDHSREAANRMISWMKLVEIKVFCRIILDAIKYNAAEDINFS